MPVSRLPAQDDFAHTGGLHLDIVHPGDGKTPVNVLVLLHGLGDTKDAFTTLGRNLNLPETACLSLQGFMRVPDIFTGSEKPSFHWGEDVIFDSTSGGIDPDAGFTKTIQKFRDDIIKPLAEKCNFHLKNIFCLGFGQGGMAALSYAASLEKEKLGGIISIGGPLSKFAITSSKNSTPILVCGGNRNTAVTRSAIDRLKQAFGDVEYVKWDREGDGMMRNRSEMLPLMRFWGRKLGSRAGVVEGAIEL